MGTSFPLHYFGRFLVFGFLTLYTCSCKILKCLLGDSIMLIFIARELPFCKYFLFVSRVFFHTLYVTHLSMRSAQNTMGTRGPIVTPSLCGAVGERAQMILVWMRAPGVGKASYPWRLGVTRIRP